MRAFRVVVSSLTLPHLVLVLACGGDGEGGPTDRRPNGYAGGSGQAGSGSGGDSSGAGGGGGDESPKATGGEETGGSDGGGSGGGGSGGQTQLPDDFACRTDGDGTTTLAFANGCAEAVAFRGSDIEGGTLAPGGVACVDIGSDLEALSAKRYWGFIGEDPGGEHHTLAEFTFNTDFYDFDWYNISHVDAHNLPMQIVPAARPDCEVLTCEESWLSSCPEIGQLKNDSGEVVSCISPHRDDPRSEVALFFEACDDAYAWSGDDQEGEDPSPVRACAGEDWDIVFCPRAE